MDWKRLRSNPDYWQIFHQRQEVVDNIRQFFKREGFLEIQTPNLSPFLIPESYLEVFETKLWDRLGKEKKAYLTPSPELWHKKLLAAGSGNIFEITKSFRNTDMGGHFHNPEFTILEWYRVEADYQDTMRDCENLIKFINKNKPSITYQGKILDISQPFEKISVIEAFERFAGISDGVLFNEEALREMATEKGYHPRKSETWEDLYNFIYVKEIEPNLGQEKPTIIYDFPTQFAPLAKTNSRDSRVKERFELYLFGIELADAYSELTDPKEQKRQFIKEQKQRQLSGKIKVKPDWDFIAALESGLPSCSGVALGVDRLLMILADQTDINEVILFSGEDLFS
jgi:EF-P lysine aminoacylase GenX